MVSWVVNSVGYPAEYFSSSNSMSFSLPSSLSSSLALLYSLRSSSYLISLGKKVRTDLRWRPWWIFNLFGVDTWADRFRQILTGAGHPQIRLDDQIKSQRDG